MMVNWMDILEREQINFRKVVCALRVKLLFIWHMTNIGLSVRGQTLQHVFACHNYCTVCLSVIKAQTNTLTVFFTSLSYQ